MTRNTSETPAPQNRDARREPTSSIISKLLKRIFRHLTRRVALLAITLGCLAAFAAIVVGPSEPIGQVMLVLLGILVSVVVLPEAPHRLWNVQPEDLAETVPFDRLLKASRNLSKAIDIQARTANRNELPAGLIESAWERSLNTIVEMIDDPSKVVRNLDYSSEIGPAGKAGDWHSVHTTIKAQRHLPRTADRYVWFSYCSTMAALSDEFDQHSEGCIAREWIQMQENEDAAAWFSRVEKYHVYFQIDGDEVERIDTKRVSTSEGHTFRVMFDAGVLAERFMSTELRMEFELPSDMNNLPVKFAAYSVVGTASVTIQVRDNNYEVDYDEYLSPADRNLSINRDLTATFPICRIRTKGQTVLPVGAGAVFSWKRKI